ncbi:fruiting body protein SC1-like [Bradysia coprophila]|uniref:fruiting body protein SC1-like n=1 Tax=Bradysia coprophila TaxID=38358 RepID=UPI00187D7220|nr:fruiting body protein SC1-like [Bradysia coprophila]
MNRRLFAAFFLLCAVQSSLGGGDGHDGDYMKCSSGTVQCCNGLKKKNIVQVVLQALGLLNAAPFNILGDVDVTCTPVAVGVQGGAVSGQSCTGQTLCCSDNDINGFIATGCYPYNLNVG